MKRLLIALLCLWPYLPAYGVDMTLPSVKGSALNTAEFEANHKRQLTAKTANYTTVATDNRDTIEVNSSGAVTITLGDASDMVATADTGDYIITIVSIGTGTTTIARTSTDTISGATSYTLDQWDSVVLKVNNAGSGYDILSAYKINDMYATTLGIGTTAIPHGAVGAALLAIEGADSTEATGPNVQFTTASDNYPLLQILNYSHDNSYISVDAYSDGTWKSSDAGSNYQIAKTGDTFAIKYDSGIAAGSAVTWNTGLSMNTSGTVTIAGSISHTKACDSSFTRVGPGFCLDNVSTTPGTSLTRDACTTITAPSSDAKSILIYLSAYARAANSVSARTATIDAYSDGSCTANIKRIAYANGYEFSALAGNEILGNSSTNDIWLELPSTGATVYFKFSDDAGNNGLGQYDIVGYTDN